MSRLGLAFALRCRQDFGNLRWIDRRGHVAVDDLKFSPGGLVRDRCYRGLDNFAAVKADPDAGAYAVIHIAIILASYPSQARPAIESARNGLAVMREEWFGGLAESMKD